MVSATRVVSFLLMLWWSVLGLAQSNSSPPVWVPIFTERTSTGTYDIPGSSNVGQNQHLLKVTLTDQGAVGSCTASNPPTTLVRMEGSFNSTSNFVSISPALTPTTSTTLEFYGFGFGSFPFLRVNLVARASACKVTVFYSGSLQTTPATQAIPDIGLGYQRVSQNTALGAGTVTDTGIVAKTGARVVVYGLDLRSTAAALLTLQEFTDNTCTTSVGVGDAILFQRPLVANGEYHNAPAAIPYWRTTTIGSTVCITSSVGGATTWAIWYRYE